MIVMSVVVMIVMSVTNSEAGLHLPGVCVLCLHQARGEDSDSSFFASVGFRICGVAFTGPVYGVWRALCEGGGFFFLEVYLLAMLTCNLVFYRPSVWCMESAVCVKGATR